MRLCEIVDIVGATLLSPEACADIVVRSGFAADLMSDALRYDLAGALLVSGLANPQVVRTAEMADVAAIVLVRGKVPQPETLQVAVEARIPILTTELIMFEVCGRLFGAGLPACPAREGPS